MSVDLKVIQIGREHEIALPPPRVVLRQCILSTLLWLGRPGFRCEAVIDTAAPLTVIPASLWTNIEDRIEWLSDPEDARLPRWLRFGMGYTGGEIPCRIGRLPCGFVDETRKQISSPVSIVAKCLLPVGKIKLKHCMLVGLQSGVLQGLKLVFDASGGTGQLIDPDE